MNLPLHRKYRPESLGDMLGNDDVVESLRVKVVEGITTTYLFHGERGCGKTTLARITADMLGATKRNIYELDLADVGLKDKARSIINSTKFMPLGGDSKVYIFDEIQDASVGFQSAMLKTLEEPPTGVYFILCTTNPDKLIKTVRSRCTPFKVIPLRRPQMMKLLTDVCNKEDVDIPKGTLKDIAKKAEGIPREALTLLDKIINVEDEEDVKMIIEDHTGLDEYSPEVKELCRLLMDHRSWKEVGKVIKALKDDPENTRRRIIGYLGAVMLSNPSQRIYEVIECMSEHYMYCGKAGLIRDCYFLSESNID